ncbi:MAG: hypothetical protein ACRC2T_12045 [Thermoguttaceae bacterium]
MSRDISVGYKIALTLVVAIMILLMLYFPLLLWKIHSSVSQLAVHRTVEKEIGVIKNVTNLFRSVVFQIISLAILGGIAFLLTCLIFGVMARLAGV